MARDLRLLAFAFLVCAATAAGQTPPNLLLVVIDDLGPEFVGCYRSNATPASTPTLDGLAAKGIRFVNAYANPVCTPTRSCLMTGRHAFRSDMEITCWPGDPGLRDEEWILPEAMQSLGYSSALIGKWHLGDRHGPSTPNIQGWSHFVGAMYGNIPSYTSWQKVSNGITAQTTVYATTDQVDEALAWILRQRHPWMLMLSFHAPHTPLHAPPAHLHRQNLAGLSPSSSPVPFYKAMVEATDRELGRLLSSLGAIRDRTNVLVMSDNGAPSGISIAPPTRAKGSLYEGGIRVPMIVQGPDVVRPGRIAQDRVHAIDVFPTLWELGGGINAAPLATFDGLSFAPILSDLPMPARPVHCESIGTGFGSGIGRIEGDYKLIRYSDDPVMMPHEELYCLRSDPNESRDLIAHGMSPADLAAYASLSDGLWALRPRGHIQALGTDCPTTAGSVRLKSYAPPSVGVMHFLRVLSPGVGANTSRFPATVWLGADAPSWNGVSFPLQLGPAGMPGCTLWAHPEFVVFTGLTDTLFGVNTPSSPSMLGVSIRGQAIVADPGANAAGLATSAGYRFTLGSW